MRVRQIFPWHMSEAAAPNYGTDRPEVVQLYDEAVAALAAAS